MMDSFSTVFVQHTPRTILLSVAVYILVFLCWEISKSWERTRAKKSNVPGVPYQVGEYRVEYTMSVFLLTKELKLS
jgi:hypothetical protein